jgi:hypothetical protein
MGKFIHPALAARLTNFMTRQVSIQIPSSYRDSVKQQITNYDTFLDNHTELPCFIGVTQSGGETRGINGSIVTTGTTIQLAGYYPLITEKMRALLDDDTSLDIIRVRHDSALNMTELFCQVVK